MGLSAIWLHALDLSGAPSGQVTEESRVFNRLGFAIVFIWWSPTNPHWRMRIEFLKWGIHTPNEQWRHQISGGHHQTFFQWCLGALGVGT